jgi:hypothetical protein
LSRPYHSRKPLRTNNNVSARCCGQWLLKTIENHENLRARRNSCSVPVQRLQDPSLPVTEKEPRRLEDVGLHDLLDDQRQAFDLLTAYPWLQGVRIPVRLSPSDWSWAALQNRENTPHVRRLSAGPQPQQVAALDDQLNQRAASLLLNLGASHFHQIRFRGGLPLQPRNPIGQCAPRQPISPAVHLLRQCTGARQLST